MLTTKRVREEENFEKNQRKDDEIPLEIFNFKRSKVDTLLSMDPNKPFDSESIKSELSKTSISEDKMIDSGKVQYIYSYTVCLA